MECTRISARPLQRHNQYVLKWERRFAKRPWCKKTAFVHLFFYMYNFKHFDFYYHFHSFHRRRIMLVFRKCIFPK